MVTGSSTGKSVMIMFLCLYYLQENKKVTVLVPNSALKAQFMADLE